MDLELESKRAVVTGGSRGIGKAVARVLAHEGCDVALVARSPEPLQEAAAELAAATGRQVVPVVADTGSTDSVAAMVTSAQEQLGGIDILVNSAAKPMGQSAPPKLADITDELFWDDVNVKVLGYLRCAQAVAPLMIEQGWGRIIHISSRAHLGNPTQANYSAAKAGLIGMAKALAIEEGRYGITVNCVAPGFMETEMVQALPTYETIKERAIQMQPIKRVGRPDDIADAVAFLASERAGFISGEVLHVTGGRYG